MKKLFIWFGEVFFHSLCVLIVIYVWWIVAKWYVGVRPLLGVDFFNTATYAKYLSENYAPIVGGWKYIWWSGHPLQFDYPALHMHLMALFVKTFGTIPVVQWYMMAMVLVYLVFAYLTFWEMARNRGIATMMTMWGGISISMYGALTWGGSMPFFATQAFLPIAAYFLSRFLKRGDESGVLVSAVVAGISVWGHVQTTLVYILPILLIVLFFSVDKGMKKSLRMVFIFSVVFFLVAYPKLYGRYIPDIPKIPVSVVNKIASFVSVRDLSKKEASSTKTTTDLVNGDAAKYAKDLAAWNENNLNLIWDKNHPWFWVVLLMVGAIYALTLLLFKNKGSKLSILGILLCGPYFALFIYLLYLGVGIPFGGWYRVYWPVPFLVGWMVSAMWGQFIVGINHRLIQLILSFCVSCTAIVIGAWGVSEYKSTFFTKSVDKKLAYSEASSAWPTLVNYLVDNKYKNFVEKLLVPNWINPNERNYRLYAADAQVNIWWNSKFKMPMQRGYIDPPIGNDRKGGFFWWEVTATNDQLVKIFNVPEPVAKNNAYFLANWFGIKYLELGHASTSFSSLSSYLKGSDFVKREEELFFIDNPKLIDFYLGNPLSDVQFIPYSGGSTQTNTKSVGLGEFSISGSNTKRIFLKGENKERYKVYGKDDGKEWAVLPSENEVHGAYVDISILGGGNFDLLFKYSGLQSLHYYELSENLVAPIMSTSDSKVIAVVGKDNYYESFFRALGMENINSKYLIPIRLDKKVEDLNYEELKKFDMVFLYGYSSKTTQWPEMEKWVREGGKLWVDTGGDSPQTESSSLPSVFPMLKTSKLSLGRNLQASNANHLYLKDVNSNQFAELILDGKPWFVSSGQNLKPGAVVVLESNGNPLMVESNLGKGKVVWSGFNLPYHILVHSNIEEGRLVKNILDQEIGLVPEPPQKSLKIDWSNSQNVTVNMDNEARGVIFREQDYGWKVYAGGERLDTYMTGPTWPGYVYVPTQGLKTPLVLDFKILPVSYRLMFYYFISLLAMLTCLDKAFLGQKIFGWAITPVWKWTKSKMGGWWEKEENY